MSSILLCPECNQRLKVPETAAGKAVRCPHCGARVPPAAAPDVAETEEPSAPGEVTTAPSPRPVPGSPRRRPSLGRERDEAALRPIRKRYSAGLVIGLISSGVLLLLLLLAGTWIGLSVSARLNKTIPAADWKSFSPPGGNCSVLMPGTPVSKPIAVNGLAASKYLVERDRGNVVFGIVVVDLGAGPLQPNALQTLIDAERDNMVRTVNGRVAGETAVMLGALPGREFQVTPPGRGAVIERLYLARVGGVHRAYLLVAAGDSIQPGAGAAARFFDSFQVDPSAAPPTYVGVPVALGPKPPEVKPNPQPQPVPNPNPRPKRPRPKRPRPGEAAGGRKLWFETSGSQTISLAFSPDGETLAVGHWDQKLRLWDPAASRDRAVVPTGMGPVFAVAFSPDGKRLATAGDAGKVALRDPATGKEQTRIQILHTQAKERNRATALAFSPDGKVLATGILLDGTPSEVHLWDLGANKETAALPNCGGPVKGLAFAADGALVVLMPNTVKVCDAASLKVRREFKAANPAEEFITSAVSPDGRTLATLGVDRKLKTWKLATGECLHTCPVQADVIRQSWFPLAFSPDGKTLALGARGPRVYLWDAQTGKDRQVIPAGHSGFVDVLTFSPDGRLLALHGSDGPRILDVAP